jgi:hypothetical protein
MVEQYMNTVKEHQRKVIEYTRETGMRYYHLAAGIQTFNL